MGNPIGEFEPLPKNIEGSGQLKTINNEDWVKKFQCYIDKWMNRNNLVLIGDVIAAGQPAASPGGNDQSEQPATSQQVIC